MKIKNEAELLSMFCDKNEFRELLRMPFFNTRYNEVWSTDGHVLIRIKPERLVGEYPKGKLNLPSLECPCKKKVTIEALNKALNECPKVDEEIVIQDAVECKECDGTGEIEHEKTKKTGKKIVNEKAVINVGNAYFFANNLYRLKFAMDFLGITSADLISNPDMWSNEFILDDDIHITLMPMLFDHTCECDAKLELI